MKICIRTKQPSMYGYLVQWPIKKQKLYSPDPASKDKYFLTNESQKAHLIQSRSMVKEYNSGFSYLSSS